MDRVSVFLDFQPTTCQHIGVADPEENEPDRIICTYCGTIGLLVRPDNVQRAVDICRVWAAGVTVEPNDLGVT